MPTRCFMVSVALKNRKFFAVQASRTIELTRSFHTWPDASGFRWLQVRMEDAQHARAVLRVVLQDRR